MWKRDKKWSEDRKLFKPADQHPKDRILRRQGHVVMFQAGAEFGVRDMETGEELCPRSPHIQVIQETYEHTWRRRYAGDPAKGFK